MATPTNFMPQDDYLVTQAQLLTDLDRKTLIYLYQPMVGAVSVALYQSFWAQVKQHPLFTRDRQPHTNLLATLGVGVDEFYNARIRLEAVGLIKAYTQFDTSRHYVYEMYAPLAPDKFFADDLFSVALYDTVGAEQYLTLSKAFTVTPVRRSDMHDISKKFMDVFHVSGDVASVPEDVRTVREATAAVPAPVTKIDVNVVDWELLERQLQGLGLASGELMQHQRAIAQVAGFYGLDTSTVARLLGRSLDTMTGKINDGRLRREAEQTYSRDSGARMHQTQPVAQEPASQPSTNPDTAKAQQTQTDQLMPVTDPTAEEKALLQRARSMPIREFLETTKKAKNSKMFAASNELFAVQQLFDQNLFDMATLNILVAYILKNRPSISAAYLNSVANAWLADDVSSPELALAEIRRYKQGKGRSTQTHRRTNYSNRPQRKEPVPDWAKADYKVPDSAVSSETKKAMAERMARLDNIGKGDS